MPHPPDPQDWTDDQWLAWLAETDAVDAAVPRSSPRRPQANRRGLGGQMLAAAMTGMAEVMYGPKEPPAIVIETSGGPPDDDALELHLDPDHPDESVVFVRPWLLRGGGR